VTSVKSDVVTVGAPSFIVMAALIMLGTLFGLIILIFALVLRYDPEARGTKTRER
jgi:hypothetical protein